MTLNQAIDTVGGQSRAAELIHLGHDVLRCEALRVAIVPHLRRAFDTLADAAESEYVDEMAAYYYADQQREEW